jgi:hypothetical protein
MAYLSQLAPQMLTLHVIGRSTLQCHAISGRPLDEPPLGRLGSAP